MQFQSQIHSSVHRTRRETKSGIRLWLKLIDATLTAIEQVVWEAREVGERALAQTRRLPAHTQRLAATGWCLTKIAASYRLHITRSAFTSRARAADRLEALHATNAKRFYELSIQHGGAFLKVGQLLSTRADLLPAAWITQLSLLQDRAPTVPFEDIREVIEAEVGRPIAAVFATFDETPIAAASIGQVHRATTADGRALAVKVQRPGIKERVEQDLELLEAFVRAASSSLPPSDWDTIVTEVRRMITAELDYPRELRTMGRLGAHLNTLDGVRAPVPVTELSGERVLVSSFEPGRRLTEVLDELGSRGETEQLAAILGQLLQAYMSQILETGLFQADPHPGNFLVTDDHVLVILDYGCAKELKKDVRDLYLSLVQAALLSDRARLVRLLDELGFRTLSGDPATLEHFAEAMLGRFREGATSGQLRFPERGAVLGEMRRMMRAVERDPVVRVPDHFVMLARVFSTLGGLFLHYRPELNYANYVMPAVARALAG